jgi:hypothetical protein
MCIVNATDGAKDLSMERFIEGLGGRKSGKEIITGRELTLSGTLTVPAKTFMLIELR